MCWGASRGDPQGEVTAGPGTERWAGIALALQRKTLAALPSLRGRPGKAPGQGRLRGPLGRSPRTRGRERVQHRRNHRACSASLPPAPPSRLLQGERACCRSAEHRPTRSCACFPCSSEPRQAYFDKPRLSEIISLRVSGCCIRT